MRCLCCHQTFYSLPSWANVLFLEEEEPVCPECSQQLMPLDEGDQCVSCSRSLSRLKTDYRKGDQCLDCWRWEQASETQGLLVKNSSLYEYNSFLKEWLTMYKFRGDAIVASFFSKKLLAVYRKHYSKHLVLPIPLSKERLLARGFNQAQLLVENWPNYVNILTRMEGEKQSKKNRKERIAQVKNQPFRLEEGAEAFVCNRSIVLVDDVYTTGTTVRQAARLLKEAGAKQISSLTIAR